MSENTAHTADVLILSDTHLSEGSRLPDAVLRLADRADHIIHAGDHSVLDVHTVLSSLAPTTAVHGNIEEPECFDALEETAFVTIAGVRFGVVHIEKNLVAQLPKCDVRVFGHSHMPELTQSDDGSWRINPGSPVQRRRAPFHSVVWLEIRSGVVASVELVDISAEGS